MKVRFFVTSFLLLVFSYTPIFSQCFERFFEAGQAYLEALEFDKAKAQFSAADKCDDKPDNFDLDVWQDTIQNRYIRTLEDALARAVRLILDQAMDDIYQLHYEAALKKIKTADALGVLKDQVAIAYLEIAFWHNEVGNTHRAIGILDSVATLAGKEALVADFDQLPKEVSKVREKIRSVLKQFDPDTYQKLWERYYPIMVSVPGGTFNMNCDLAIDPGCRDDVIQHEATVSDFELSKYETTWWQYYLFCQANGHEYKSPGWGADGDNPAVNICWYDAIAYANWISQQQGLELTTEQNQYHFKVNIHSPGYRLPTEAEWEYAARGGTAIQSTIYSGSNILDSVGWYPSNSKSRTQPVGQLKANLLGLHDMSGNVWEWCWDWYGDYLVDPPPPKDYSGPDTGSWRVLRGGSWYFVAASARVSTRLYDYPDRRNFTYGFRLAKAVTF